MERLQPSRSVDRSPLFQAMLALDNTPRAEFKLKGLQVQRLPLHGGSAKYDLSLSLREEHDGLSATLSYDADIFDETTARRFIDHYVKLIESAVAEPAERVSKLPLLTEAEQQLLSMSGTRRSVHTNQKPLFMRSSNKWRNSTRMLWLLPSRASE